jgi:hypothetical protein
VRALLPTALLGLALMLGTFFGPELLRRLRHFFSFPAYGHTALCPHCVVPLPTPQSHVCPSCMLPVSGFAATDPILQVLATGAVYRQASHRLVGAGLAGVIAFCVVTLALALTLWFEGERSASFQTLFFGSPWFIVLFKGVAARHLPQSGT